jgi:hypothetical protein
MKLMNNVLKFSESFELTPLIKHFGDYFNTYRAQFEDAKVDYEKTGIRKTDDGREEVITLTFADKEQAINREFREAVYKMANVTNPNVLPEIAWATNPQVTWAAFAIVSTMIDAVLPDTLIDSIGAYTDIRTIGFGDSAVFNIEPRDLFPVTKAGRGKRNAEMQKQFVGQVALVPENHMLTVGVSLYRVLSGAESLARFAAKAIRSLETQVALDAYTAFNAAMIALPTTAGNAQLRAAGWDSDTFVNFAQKVTAWNGGAQAIGLGTKRALAQVLPTVDTNYRYDLESDYVKVGYIRQLNGYNFIELAQVADWQNPFGLSLNDDVIYIMSPAAQKPVKLVLEGTTLSYTDNTFDRANLNQTTTFQKSWIAGVATNAVAATITL